MQALRNTFLDLVSNRIGDSRSAPSTIRCVIYKGLMYTRPTGSVLKCPGYNKEGSGVWVCPKDKWDMFLSGKWAADRIDTIISDVQSVVGVSKERAVRDELDLRTSTDTLQAIQDLQNNQPTLDDTVIGIMKVPDKAAQSGVLSNMWKQLAFYHEEVVYVELKPHEEDRIPGKDIRPETCQIVVPINASGRIESTGAEIILHPQLSRLALNACPKGGGYDPFKDSKSFVARRTSATGHSIKLQRFRHAFNAMYSGLNERAPFDLALDGDVWKEGVRTSIGRGLFEVWVDNRNMGPMLRISRNSVQQAAARYTRDVGAAQMRYAGERDHPASADVASTAVTPVRVYIEDWFGDPGFYAGLINTLMLLVSGLDGEGDEAVYRDKYLDLGAFDYGKIYNKYEGVEV